MSKQQRQRIAFLPEEIRRRVETYRTDPVLVALREKLSELISHSVCSFTWDYVNNCWGPTIINEPSKSMIEYVEKEIEDYISSRYGDIINIAEPAPEFKMGWLIPKGKGSADDLPPVNFFP